MKELITKSLFNAVYNCDISKDSDMLRYYNRISMYEFAFKCKEWAYKQEIGKTGTYFNGCGWSQQHLMYGINIVTKYCDNEYIATIDNDKDLNCSLDFYGLSAMHHSSVKEFEYKANTVKDICFYANTEPEAIFKACHWILENIK